ncbi:orcokinin peptides type B [Trichonephila clavata]|uniref:Orcokinin peptides type B n=1 Tax=Trichonephila clavata TaxID=2740835 RepID=A0A8X6IAF8_TRICU|nr:orcokinin peptides type B [Trichonephila clavata]
MTVYHFLYFTPDKREVPFGREYDAPAVRFRNGGKQKRSLRVLRGMSYFPLDKIGGGVVLRELQEDEPTEQPRLPINDSGRSSHEKNQYIVHENLKNSQFPTFENSELMNDDSAHLNRKRREAKNFEINEPIRLEERNFDEIDRSSFRNIGKRNFDEIDRAGFRTMGKRNFDEIDRSGFHNFGKRNFDEIDRAGFHNLGKRNFDEIDRAGFRNMGKRNFDEIDRAGFRQMGKRNFDEIDRTGFHNFGKRNFDEIDRAGFHKIGKKNFDEIDRSGFGNIGKRDFDEIDRSGFSSIGKRNFRLLEKPGFYLPFADKFSFPNPGNVPIKELGAGNLAEMFDMDMNKENKKSFDEIDRSGFGGIGKRNFDEIDRSGFGNILKRNFDEIDRSGFNHIASFTNHVKMI